MKDWRKILKYIIFKKQEQCKIFEPKKSNSCNNLILKECIAIPAAVFAASFGQPETSWSDDPVTPSSAASGCQLLLPFPLELHSLVPQMRRLVQESKKISLLPIWVHKEFDELLRYCYCSKSQKSKSKNEMLKKPWKPKNLNTIDLLWIWLQVTVGLSGFKSTFTVFTDSSQSRTRERTGDFFTSLQLQTIALLNLCGALPVAHKVA